MGIEDRVEEIDSLAKENVKAKNSRHKTSRKTRHHEKSKSLIIGIEEGEETQAKGTENIFNKIIGENFPGLRKRCFLNMQKAYRIPHRKENQ